MGSISRYQPSGASRKTHYLNTEAYVVILLSLKWKQGHKTEDCDFIFAKKFVGRRLFLLLLFIHLSLSTNRSVVFSDIFSDQYVGCYESAGSGFLHQQVPKPTTTNSIINCVNYCRSQQYTFAGVQVTLTLALYNSSWPETISWVVGPSNIW